MVISLSENSQSKRIFIAIFVGLVAATCSIILWKRRRARPIFGRKRRATILITAESSSPLERKSMSKRSATKDRMVKPPAVGAKDISPERNVPSIQEEPATLKRSSKRRSSSKVSRRKKDRTSKSRKDKKDRSRFRKIRVTPLLNLETPATPPLFAVGKRELTAAAMKDDGKGGELTAVAIKNDEKDEAIATALKDDGSGELTAGAMKEDGVGELTILAMKDIGVDELTGAVMKDEEQLANEALRTAENLTDERLSTAVLDTVSV
ncbi:unnamed protein product [Nippostrongylus brasiliensis]|uniref:Uncharacterized protein n=1 Tax=Nippostrongylus brasiliensis TaxID=27835 RepID=A0A0N4XZM8_NIPBR|nr:unnamed protein product [Nippostrongylus brasiliensis]